MKKKILCAVFSLLMVCSLVIGTSAGTVTKKVAESTINSINNPTYNYGVASGTGTAVTSPYTTSMQSTCPSCGKDTAIYYVDGGKVYSYCYSCGKTTVVYEPDKTTSTCAGCTGTCTCMMLCPNDGSIVTCGQKCSKCGQTVTCAANCPTCKNTQYYTVYIQKNVGGTVNESGTCGKASYNEVKHFDITTEKGYRVAAVVVNGTNYGDVDELDVTVTGNVIVYVWFEKYDTSAKYAVSASYTGAGKITLSVNGTGVSKTSYSAKYSDTLKYTFKAETGYKISDVKVNGVSIGAKSSYTISKIREAVTIQVTFTWKNPFSDVDSAHLESVAFVYTNKIMSSPNVYFNTDLFYGNTQIQVGSFAATLAEFADTENELSNRAERIQWAMDNGLIAEDADIKAVTDTKTACEIINKFLAVVQEAKDFSIKGYSADNTAAANCAALGIITDAEYTANANITRYDTADICYAIAQLGY